MANEIFEILQIVERESTDPEALEYDVFVKPIMPLKFIKVDVRINRPFVKLKTRFQILKEECF
jgi:hypothetical protein